MLIALWLRVKERMRDETGAEYVEYVVIGALAVLVILGAVQFFFDNIAALFRRIAEALTQIG
jgi:Flp pilus assembly pilin Flp